ncbi:MAG: aldehyde dehydrogenase family protein [Rhodospirillales bacterium]|nr:aldehyde dehydrogenase family protein [Rhodospirillales bacterium]
MASTLRTITPVNGSLYVERDFANEQQIAAALSAARDAQVAWRNTPISERAAICTRAVDAFVAAKDDIAGEISWQMGRPIAYAAGEVGGFEERARHMIKIAAGALADIAIEEKQGFTRYIRREALGVVFIIAPWNFPYLTAINAIMPAIMAGNSVILKHSAQTPLCAERIDDAFKAAGLPDGVFQYLHLSHSDTERVIKADEVNFVAFTGSVPGGQMVEEAAAGRFIGVGLELGGKDPGYVRPDANLEHAIDTLVDGAFFNSGQSCCGIERIYAHADIYDAFVEGAVELVKKYQLGDPLDPATTIGPMVRTGAAEYVRGQIRDAVAAGGQALIDPSLFPAHKEESPYLAPQVMIDVDHSMEVMMEESFGPVVGIMKVSSDAEAIAMMNDSPYGLTASVFTMDADAAAAIGDQVNTGTWFMNRCDYLDPALAWTGIKNSGRGCTLSALGYDHMTRPKSFHLKTAL